MFEGSGGSRCLRVQAAGSRLRSKAHKCEMIAAPGNDWSWYRSAYLLSQLYCTFKPVPSI
jgi:hypothetical protein